MRCREAILERQGEHGISHWPLQNVKLMGHAPRSSEFLG